ncbi:MAG: aldose 1-epimerase [Terriglobales bacterium]|jgi:galactose mutarotase-like enzyme
MNLKVLFMLFLLLLLTAVCWQAGSAQSEAPKPQTVIDGSSVVGGMPVITLERPRLQTSNVPQFLSVQVLPGRGMNLFQIRAYLPGKGEINLISSPSVEDAAKLLAGGPDDPYGNESFKLGGAILVPYANRIRGKLSADGKTIDTQIAGKPVTLLANWQGKNPGAEKHAMHGMILDAKFGNLIVAKYADESHVEGTLHAGNFSGHWLSSADINVRTTLHDSYVEMEVTVKNVGQENLPLGIGWHPYFAFPSGDRQQARLHIPATQRAIVNNYDDVFPTGKIVPMAGSPYDFTPVGGAPLKDQFLDESFIDLKRQPDGSVVTEVIDPAADYGLRITAFSKDVSAIQVYSPPEKSFVAIEPQFNYGDPYGKEWGKTKTGMVEVKPGESASYRVRLEMFQPGQSGGQAK